MCVKEHGKLLEITQRREKFCCTVEKCLQEMELTDISAWTTIMIHEIIRFQASYIQCWSTSTFYNGELPLV